MAVVGLGLAADIMTYSARAAKGKTAILAVTWRED